MRQGRSAGGSYQVGLLGKQTNEESEGAKEAKSVVWRTIRNRNRNRRKEAETCGRSTYRREGILMSRWYCEGTVEQQLVQLDLLNGIASLGGPQLWGVPWGLAPQLPTPAHLPLPHRQAVGVNVHSGRLLR